MTFPTVTMQYGTVLALIFIALSITVVVFRAKYKTPWGDGGHVLLQRAIRAQGNFAEYVPIALILLAGCEMGEASEAFMRGWAGTLIIARILHPMAMFIVKENAVYFFGRVVGTTATWAVIIAAAWQLICITCGCSAS